MAPGRGIFDSLRPDDVVIPFWLRVVGVAVGGVVVVLVAVSAFTAGHPPKGQGAPGSAGAGPPAFGSAAFGAVGARPAGAGPETPTVSGSHPPVGSRSGTPPPSPLPGLPAPLTSDQFHDPGAVAAAFAAAYETWVSPDGPPGSAARVEPYTTAALFAHFPEPSSWPAPSALAAIDQVAVAVSSAQTRVATVRLTQQLLGQDGRPLGPPQASVLQVTVEQQPDGTWLVGWFTAG
jgi:hypothetical protein